MAYDFAAEVLLTLITLVDAMPTQQVRFRDRVATKEVWARSRTGASSANSTFFYKPMHGMQYGLACSMALYV